MSATTRIAVMIWLGLLALLCSQLASSCVDLSAAPAPLLKDRDGMPVSLAGDWIIEWGGSEYVTHLSADGTYRCYSATYNTCVYDGTWTMTGRTLSVSESVIGCIAQHWQVKLDRGMRGVGTNDIKIRLRRVR